MNSPPGRSSSSARASSPLPPPHDAAGGGRGDVASRPGRQQPERVADMQRQYEAWAARCGVLPRDKVVALMRSQGVTRAFWEEE